MDGLDFTRQQVRAHHSRRMRALWVLIVVALFGTVPPAARAAASRPSAVARTARYLDTIRRTPAKLRAFLRAMPKGADLHNHLSGAVPTETLIGYAVKDRLCFDANFKATPSADGQGACPAGQRPAAESSTDPAFFTQIVRAWSMQDFRSVGGSGHNHFFDTFDKFGWATSPNPPTTRKGEMLADVARINASQHVLYLETLVSRQGPAVNDLLTRVTADPNNPKLDPANPDLPALRRELMSNGAMGAIAMKASAETDADLARYRQLLRCGTRRADAACALQVRFDFQVGRGANPETVFANLLLGFELQSRDHRYVGVNLVQPEDGAIAVRDYTLQMEMVRYLRAVYPSAHVTLHAGELVSGLVPPLALQSHVEIAGSERIGHGVDVEGELDASGLLAEMARRHVLVEVPLTSNAQILGVLGGAHPIVNYLAAGVPVALATDDPGVERTDLTQQYQLATTRYRLGYRTLKTLSRASLEHAFLPGASLWRSPDRYRPARACAADRLGGRHPSGRCRALLARSVKARTQWRLERGLRAFEHHRR
jgi:adenosine deaminase